MPKLCNLARMTTATTGTGTITLGVAVSGYLTFANAGVANGDVVFYGLKDGAGSEVGWGTYASAGTTLTRNVARSTNANAAISLSGSAEAYITALAGDGGDLLPGFDHPLRGFDMPINLQLNASVASNLLTVAVKGNNGSDPSNGNPILIPFRDPTAANGGPIWRAITGALSINTNATGATLGTANSVPFRLWVLAFDNAGTVVLALWQSVTGGASPSAIAPLNEAATANTTGISGSATSAGTFYTPNGTSLTAKSFRILGYLDYASGLTTAGTYASAPTTMQLFGPGSKKPGDLVQRAFTTTGALATGTAAIPLDDTIPQNTEGTQFMSLAISPQSGINLLEVDAKLELSQDVASTILMAGALFQDANANALAVTKWFPGASGNSDGPVVLYWLAPGTSSATTFKVRCGSHAGGQISFNGRIGTRVYGGACNSYMRISELMV